MFRKYQSAEKFDVLSGEARRLAEEDLDDREKDAEESRRQLRESQPPSDVD